MPDNLIAIGGLVVAALGIVVPYFTNKANIKARRAEIAAEKSIEVYREMVEKLNVLQLYARSTPWNLGYSDVVDATSHCYSTFIKYRLYFPKQISEDILSVVANFQRLIEPSTEEDKKKQLRKHEDELEQLIAQMQKIIGIELSAESNQNMQSRKHENEHQKLVAQMQKYSEIEVGKTLSRKKSTKA